MASYVNIKNPSLLNDNNKLITIQKIFAIAMPLATPNMAPKILLSLPATLNVKILLVYFASIFSKIHADKFNFCNSKSFYRITKTDSYLKVDRNV
jgi:hypothetical protein